MSRPHIVIVGILGKFGARLAKEFSDRRWVVSGIDLVSPDTSADTRPRYYNYLQVAESPASTLPSEIADLLRRADIVLLATPLDVTPSLVSLYGCHLPAHSLLVDIASVKTAVTASMVALEREDIELLSIHPLFAPDLEFAGENVAAIEIRGGLRTREFLELFTGWGCRITKLSASEHDHKMAFVQSLCHALIITLGGAAKAEEFAQGANADLTTPFCRTLLQLALRLGSANPELYATIQILNPYTLTVLDDYLSRLQEFRTLVESKEVGEIQRYISRNNSILDSTPRI